MLPFVHLRSRSCYSFGQGLQSPEQIVGEAARLGMRAVGLADRATLSGIPRFMKACADHGVRPLPGIVVRAVADGPEAEVCALASGEIGLRSLVKLHHRAVADERVPGGRSLRPEALALPGLVLLVRASVEGGEPPLDFLGAMPSGVEAFLACRDASEVPVGLAGLRAVAVPDPLFLLPGKHREQALLEAIGTATEFDEARAARGAARWFQDAATVAAGFERCPGAVVRAAELAERLGVDPGLLSVFAGPAVVASDLPRRARAGLQDRLPAGVDGDAYRRRLEAELSEAEALGLLADLEAAETVVRVAASDGVRKGPGRGSSCCSLLAWALGLTEIDPVVYGLPASRFFGWGPRPQIEVEFAWCSGQIPLHRRPGATTPSGSRLVGVMSCGRPSARGLAIHANRAMGGAAGKKPEAGEPVADETGGLAASMAVFPCMPFWYEHAVDLCAIPDGAILPMGRDRGDAIAMFDRTTLEMLGLPVIGVLPLQALADLEEAAGAEPLAPRAEAAAVAASLGRGEVAGMMLGGMGRDPAFVARVRPACREDLAVLRALDRTPVVARDWIERREGLRKCRPPHPLLREATKDTLGLLLFQEQVIAAIAEVCDMPETRASVLSRRLSSKKPGTGALIEQAALEAGRSPADAAGFRAVLERLAPGTSCKGHALACASLTWDLAAAKERGREAWTARRLAAFAKDEAGVMEMLRDPDAESLLRRHGVI